MVTVPAAAKISTAKVGTNNFAFSRGFACDRHRAFLSETLAWQYAVLRATVGTLIKLTLRGDCLKHYLSASLC